MSEEKEGKFIVTKITDFKDFREGMEVSESDLCFQNDNVIVQCDYKKDEAKKSKYKIKPGIYSLANTNLGVQLEKMTMKHRRMLTSYDNSKRIIDEAKLFFSQGEVYKFLEEDDVRRSICLYSPPGFGKTSAIIKLSQELVDEDSGTVVISWPTCELEARQVSRFFSSSAEYTKKCTRLVFIIEDIGGGEVEDRGGQRGVDSGLLNLLDGVDVTFPLPTFVVATTNYPANLLDALGDRPGRFDEFIELPAPDYKQRVELIKFLSKRNELNEEELKAIKKAENFSVAHLYEIIKRSMLKKLTYTEVVNQMLNHKKNFEKLFEKTKKGIGLAAL